MDVTAYDSNGVLPQVPLGAVAQGIWVNGFKFTEDRMIQVTKPIGASAPKLYDRLMTLENFQVAAGRSFTGQNPIGQALQFLATHPKSVPRLANLQFIETADGSGQVAWLKGCGITKIELVEKYGARVAFGYTIVGGVWSLK
ncbi:MAG TPA: hypothetical protein VGY56_10720 [Verrucomicrobiae bacterium]|nr:hypothetical protein [Verrucomicrobiae bacterium]